VAGLIYEIVWTRQLTLLFGVSVFAVSTVLAAFMLGLALGGYFFGRIVDRRRNPLAVYGWLEIAVGVYALLLPWLLQAAKFLYLAAYSSLPNRGSVLALRFLLALLLLVPPASFLGGTLPAVARIFSSDFGRFGNALAKLYGVNTLGAVLGAFLAGFVLIQTLGMTGATGVAVALSLFAGVVALGMSRGAATAVRPSDRVSVDFTEADEGGTSTASIRLAALVAVAISGFCSLGYEVLWTRILVLRLGNSTWAFSITLITFLLSLSIGSLLIGPWLDRRVNRLALFAALQSGAALFAGLSLPAFRWISDLSPGSGATSLAGVVVSQFWLAAIVMMPATLLLGTALPLAARIYTERPERAGTRLGATVAANTLGAVIGSVVAGFVIVPALGIQNGVLLLALANGAVGIWLFSIAPATRATRLAGLATASLVSLFLAIAILPEKQPLETPPAGFETLFYDEGVAGTVAIYHSPGTGLKTLNINHVTEVSTDETSLVTFRLMAYLPFLLHPEPKDALVVTFGAGIVAGSLAQLDLERIDCVEINPKARRIGDFFAEENRRVTASPRVRLHIEDGRNYLLTTKRRYDIITADATHPTGADSWVLYTREYYELARSRLKPGGIFLQWLPLHALSPSDYRTIVATSSSAFDGASLWFTGLEGEVGHTVLIGSADGTEIDLQRLEQRLKTPAIQEDLRDFDLDSAGKLLSLFVSDDRGLRKVASGAPINTDNRAVTAFPRELPRPGLAAENLDMVLASRSFPKLTRADSSQVEAIRASWQASGALLRSQLALRRDDLEGAEELLAQARSLEAGDSSIVRLNELTGRRLAEAYLQRGDELLEQGSREEALRTYERAAEVARAWSVPHLRMSELYRRAGDLERAYAALRSGTSLQPSAQGFFNLGLVAYQLGKTREAIAAYEEALEREPDLGVAYTNLGMIYAQMQDWQKARWAWEKALLVNPEDQLARRNLQRLQDRVGDGK
jgi:spermidine synthase